MNTIVVLVVVLLKTYTKNTKIRLKIYPDLANPTYVWQCDVVLTSPSKHSVLRDRPMTTELLQTAEHTRMSV